MTRRHRRWHLALWAIIGPLALLGLVLSIALRPAPVVETEQPWRLTHQGSYQPPHDQETLP